jgi:uncharacterized protein (DUF1810 family)
MTDLEKFLIMHERDYNKALNEIKQGKKTSHWIWYILPIMKGLRESKTAIYYGIKDFEEATNYLKNDILRAHLIEMSNALLNLGNVNIFHVMGYIDDVKLQQCMTLFNKVEKEMNINCGNVFQKVLEQFYEGKEDEKTLEILEKQKIEKEKVNNEK